MKELFGDFFSTTDFGHIEEQIKQLLDFGYIEHDENTLRIHFRLNKLATELLHVPMQSDEFDDNEWFARYGWSSKSIFELALQPFFDENGLPEGWSLPGTVAIIRCGNQVSRENLNWPELGIKWNLLYNAETPFFKHFLEHRDKYNFELETVRLAYVLRDYPFGG